MFQHLAGDYDVKVIVRIICSLKLAAENFKAANVLARGLRNFDA
jgi:hypothetical protein